MKLITVILFMTISTTAFAWKIADVDRHFGLINQCKFDEYIKLKKEVEQAEHNDSRGLQSLKIKVDAKVSKALIAQQFGTETDEAKKTNNYDCLRKFSQYK